MRKRSNGVTTPSALAWFSRFCTWACPCTSFMVSVGVRRPDSTPLLIRFACAFWRALIHGVPAKLDAEVTARTSEARSKVFMASLPLLGFADGGDTIVGARSAIVSSMTENGARDCASRHDAIANWFEVTYV